MSDEYIYKKVVETWGEESQLNQVVEEMGELIQALSKFRRADTKKKKVKAYANVCEEVADVQNMINQLKFMFDAELIEKIKKEKLERTMRRIKRTEKKIRI